MQSFNWEKAVKKTHMFPPENSIATNTEGEKGTKFLLKNNLLIRVIWTLKALVHFGILSTLATTQKILITSCNNSSGGSASL